MSEMEVKKETAKIVSPKNESLKNESLKNQSLKNGPATGQPSWWDSWWNHREERKMAERAHQEAKFLETAKIYKEAERWEEMVHVMRKVVKLCYAQSKDLSTEERSLLLEAYGHLIESHMTSWRKLRDAENKLAESIKSRDVDAELDAKAKEKAQLQEEEISEVRKERRKIELEIREICEAMIRLQNDFLIPLAPENKDSDFYVGVRKQYYEYLEEIGASQDIDDLEFIQEFKNLLDRDGVTVIRFPRTKHRAK